MDLQVVDIHILIREFAATLTRFSGRYASLRTTPGHSELWVALDLGKIEEDLAVLLFRASFALSTGTQMMIGARLLPIETVFPGPESGKSKGCVLLCVELAGPEKSRFVGPPVQVGGIPFGLRPLLRFVNKINGRIRILLEGDRGVRLNIYLALWRPAKTLLSGMRSIEGPSVEAGAAVRAWQGGRLDSYGQEELVSWN